MIWRKKTGKAIMANAEIEKTLKKITDTQLVVVRLMETHERKWDRRFEASQVRMEGLERRTEELDRGAEHLLRATEKLWRVAVQRAKGSP